MRKTINGKVYDTDTATEVASYWNGCTNSDHRYCAEELYITQKNNWFLAFEGGALSNWGVSGPNNTILPRAGISVLTPKEALRWMEKHGPEDEIEKYFGDQVEEA